MRGVFTPNVQQEHDISAFLTAQIAGERDGDLAWIQHQTDFAVQLWRYNGAPDPAVWEEQFAFSTDQPFAWATRGNGERMPDAKLPANIPYDNMRVNLFDSDITTPIRTADVTIRFDVDNVPGGETVAEATAFAVTAEQLNEDTPQIRVDYDMTDAVRAGLPPTETELILRLTRSGTIVQRLPVHDRHADTLIFDIAHVAGAGSQGLRWAIIVKTKGRYTGSIELSNVRFHSGDGNADPNIRRVASPLVRALSEDLSPRVVALEQDGAFPSLVGRAATPITQLVSTYTSGVLRNETVRVNTLGDGLTWLWSVRVPSGAKFMLVSVGSIYPSAERFPDMGAIQAAFDIATLPTAGGAASSGPGMNVIGGVVGRDGPAYGRILFSKGSSPHWGTSPLPVQIRIAGFFGRYDNANARVNQANLAELGLSISFS